MKTLFLIRFALPLLLGWSLVPGAFAAPKMNPGMRKRSRRRLEQQRPKLPLGLRNSNTPSLRFGNVGFRVIVSFATKLRQPS
jgi:hypothetical protein